MPGTSRTVHTHRHHDGRKQFLMVPFTATNNTANALTLTANGQNSAMCDGALWHLK